MAWVKHAARLAVELAVAWVVVTALAFAVMVTMFWFGPWANPPGIDEGHAVAMMVITALCLWRAYARVIRAVRREPRPVSHAGVGGE